MYKIIIPWDKLFLIQGLFYSRITHFLKDIFPLLFFRIKTLKNIKSNDLKLKLFLLLHLEKMNQDVVLIPSYLIFQKQNQESY